jgi:hypothetical protein
VSGGMCTSPIVKPAAGVTLFVKNVTGGYKRKASLMIVSSSG